jgi:mycothiol synthase
VLADLAAADPGPPLRGALVRAALPADLDAVAALYAAAADARGHTSPVRPDDLRLRWLMLDDPADAVVVEQPGSSPHLVAYASTSVDHGPAAAEVTVHLEGQVHPAATGRGLASWILHLAEAVGTRALRPPPSEPVAPAPSSEAAQDDGGHEDDRDDGTEVVRIRTALLDGDDAARRWFATRGFRPVRHLLELRLDLHAPPPAPRWPAGIRVRTFVPGADDEVLWRTHQVAFADVPTHLPIDRDDYLADRAPQDDPGLVLLAEQDGEVVGIAVCRAGTEVAAEEGWVRDLGVVPAWRRHGIAMALLRTAFAAFRDRGLTGVALEVDDVTLEGAVALYRRAGMRVTRRTDVLERARPVAGGDQG